MRLKRLNFEDKKNWVQIPLPSTVWHWASHVTSVFNSCISNMEIINTLQRLLCVIYDILYIVIGLGTY